ncbi:thiopurine S-methyltransferase [Pseudomonas sp. WS 5111]|jgi:thiopurine S-methyltransferase|uniref:thiopurine S-methyltransferase n=1 Tax=unclassified Pseudomonas TaxID=196821 RepID=UPI00147345D7|nr:MULTISPECIES: thiopurine S-methyltransferase [unclassified Pseudomonas]NMX66727.1 thiopurine S-methyltransferase [Pseudomonas sp. WS 5111]NMX87803.1 thiopurine S-methyltransferase [Pseudomonas sp. WS 5010]
MESTFWHDRWARNQIGFHLPEVNPYLQRHWPGLGLVGGARVLVPLCGKSLDLMWLAQQGCQVLGVELSEKAVEEFFQEQCLAAQVSQRGSFKVYQAGTIELWCGDFFELSREDVAGCAALYDRAALIALPPLMRERYAAHLQAIAPQVQSGLLISLDYEQALKAGPPFAVSDEEVRRLLAGRWRLSVLEQRDILAESPKFAQDGVTRLEERVYQLAQR